jgi:hypothetical protein
MHSILYARPIIDIAALALSEHPVWNRAMSQLHSSAAATLESNSVDRPFWQGLATNSDAAHRRTASATKALEIP